MTSYKATSAVCNDNRNYRLIVEGETSYLTGEFFHRVTIESRSKGERKYHYCSDMSVHCCYNATEAAYYVANRLGLYIA